MNLDAVMYGSVVHTFRFFDGPTLRCMRNFAYLPKYTFRIMYISNRPIGKRSRHGGAADSMGRGRTGCSCGRRANVSSFHGRADRGFLPCAPAAAAWHGSNSRAGAAEGAAAAAIAAGAAAGAAASAAGAAAIAAGAAAGAAASAAGAAAGGAGAAAGGAGGAACGPLSLHLIIAAFVGRLLRLLRCALRVAGGLFG